MKIRAGLSVALVAAWLPFSASAGTVALVADKELCDSDPPLEKAAQLEASRTGSTTRLVVTAELNCAYVPDKPELRAWRNAATLALPTRSPSGAAATCLCAHQMTFDISDLYEGVKTIYYAQDGTVLGHVDAP
jgi:hypothetical protein